MAKKSSGQISVADLNDFMKGGSKWGGLMSTGTVSTVKEYIHTGNYILNCALSGSILKGIPGNRTVVLSGESSTGKTYILLNIVREAQKQGYFVVYYDSENAVDANICEGFGIDLENIRYEPVATIQEFRTNITATVEWLIQQKESGMEIPKILFCLDSAGNLASQKEVTDAAEGSDKVDMTRSKTMKSLFRILMSKLGVINGSFIATNHIYKTLDLFSQNVQAGGCLSPEMLIIDGDGDEVAISKVEEGDLVMTTNGPKEVTKVWKFIKPTYEVEFEDGTKIICSDTHRFSTDVKYNDVDAEENDMWKMVTELKSGDVVYAIDTK